VSVGVRSNQYLETKIQTATPEALVGMLYEGAIRFLKQASSELSEQDWRSAHSSIVRAQNIVSELNVSLDMSKGGDIAGNLSKIYEYLNTRLIEANIKKEQSMINECVSILSDLSSAWSEVVKTSKSSDKEGITLAG